MAHFPDTGRTWVFGQIAGVAAGMDDIDTKAVNTINGITGDGGVTGVISTPTAPIIILGKGLALQNPPVWVATQTIVRRISPLRYCTSSNSTSQWTPTTGMLAAAAATQQAWLPVTQDLIDGAIVTRVRAWFIVQAGKPGLPTNYPRLYMARRNETTGIMDALAFTASNVFPNAANLTAYKNGGVPNMISCVPNNAGGTATIDKSTYSYSLGYVDDDQAGATFNTLTGFELQMTVTDQRPA